MTLSKIPDHQISAAMERLVRDGRAEWTTTRGKPALRLTAFGRAMLRHPQTAEAAQ